MFTGKKLFYFEFSFQKAPLLLAVLPSGRGKKQINTVRISHRISLNDTVQQQDKSQKMTYFYIRVKHLVKRSLSVQLRLV